MNSIISYLLWYNQYLLQIISYLCNFICRFIPLKQFAFDDSQSPKYQKLKVDKLPIILESVKQDYTFLIEYYRKRYGKTIKPVNRRTDFFKMDITSSFSASCLRSERISASNSRCRLLFRLLRSTIEGTEPDCLIHERKVSMQIPRSAATSLTDRDCSVTILTAPDLNDSSYRSGGVPFLIDMKILLSHNGFLASIPLYHDFFCLSSRGRGQYELNISDIPAYSGKPYIEINNNELGFYSDEPTTEPFETYSELDSLGRCGQAYANVCNEIMPTGDRGKIGMIKPSG